MKFAGDWAKHTGPGQRQVDSAGVYVFYGVEKVEIRLKSAHPSFVQGGVVRSNDGK